MLSLRQKICQSCYCYFFFFLPCFSLQQSKDPKTVQAKSPKIELKTMSKQLFNNKKNMHTGIYFSLNTTDIPAFLASLDKPNPVKDHLKANVNR